MTDGRRTALPELMAMLFGRIRAELPDETMGSLRMSHVRVMAAVSSDGVNVTELARRVGMTKQGCGQFVTHLSGTGHLRTSADPADGRARIVFRTALGDGFMREVYAALDSIEKDFATEVGQRRFATFKKVLTELASG